MKSTYDYLVDKVTNSLLKENAADADEAEIYRFGIEITILKSLHFLSYLVIAACMRKVLEFIIIFGVFYAFRRNVGGFHAKTRMGCYIFSCAAIAIALAAVGKETYPIFMGILALSELIVLVFIFPIRNENRPLDEEEISCFKKRLYMLIVLFVAVFTITEEMGCFCLVQLYTIGLTLATSLAVLGKIQEGGNLNEK